MSRSNSADASYADGLGLGVTCVTAAAGTALAWYAARQIGRSAARLRGMTTASVAMAFGWFVIVGCVIALVRPNAAGY